DETDIEVDAFLNKIFKGVVTEIANSAETAGTSADQVTNFKVKVKILKESYEETAKEMGVLYSPFRPGMTATVDIKTRSKKGIVAVPISAVTTRSDTTSVSKKFKGKKKKEEDGKEEGSESDDKKEVSKKDIFECVFVIDSLGKSKIRIVETGIQDDENIQITKGLNEGDEIITGPYIMVSRTLKPGMDVKEKSEDEEED
ncbi:MAG: efflux RND transporter periplasmic adaptor subunit, partial [Flavobacteriales bacterium]|nr:efflux RND transporter periplasmic adaptor subunit [Flavobacteriales bacterium]